MYQSCLPRTWPEINTQIKARREVSMFASQPQANGTNDQII